MSTGLRLRELVLLGLPDLEEAGVTPTSVRSNGRSG